MKLPYAEFDLSGLHSYPLASRPSKVRVADFARPEAARALGDVAAANLAPGTYFLRVQASSPTGGVASQFTYKLQVAVK